MSGSQENRIAQLSTALLQHEISAEEMQELEAAIETDPKAMDTFCITLRDEYVLHSASQSLNQRKRIQMPHRRTSLNQRIRKVAAGITILLTLGGVLVARYTEISQFGKNKPVTRVLATVQRLNRPNGILVSAVNDGQLRTLSVRSKLYDGDTLVVPSGAEMVFSYLDDDTRVTLSEGARLRVTQSGGKRIQMHSGKLHAEVDPQPVGMPMKLSAKDSEFEVLGTSFELLVFEQTRLLVSEGSVHCVSKVDGREVVVGADQIFEAVVKPKQLRSRRKHIVLYPVNEKVVNGSDARPGMIGVDPVRSYHAVLTFDLGEVEGQIVNADLQLRIVRNQGDFGGGGELSVFRVSENDGKQRRLIAEQACAVRYNQFLTVALDPTVLSVGENALMITLGRGGDDFWFSASSGYKSPVLKLTVEPLAQP